METKNGISYNIHTSADEYYERVNTRIVTANGES